MEHLFNNCWNGPFESWGSQSTSHRKALQNVWFSWFAFVTISNTQPKKKTKNTKEQQKRQKLKKGEKKKEIHNYSRNWSQINNLHLIFKYLKIPSFFQNCHMHIITLKQKMLRVKIKTIEARACIKTRFFNDRITRA